jgi:hypothetical protein
MAQADRIFTSDETMNSLREKAKEGDDFLVKLQRRAHLGSTPELVASFSGARVEHFASPELWVPPLCGGGKFLLQGFHATDNGKPVGGFVQFSITTIDPKEVDQEVVKKVDWRGPPALEFPLRAAPRDMMNGHGGYDIRPPPAPGSGDSATRVPQAWPRPAGGGAVFNGDYGEEREYARSQSRQAALEQERRRFELEKLELRDEKHRGELEALKKGHEADMRSFKAEILAELRTKPTGPDAGTTMLETMLKMQIEDRRASEQRQAEDRRAAETRQTANDERFNRLLEKMADRPKEDPLAMITKVTELMGKSGGGNEKMMHTMMETMGTINGVAMDFVEHAANMQLGGGEKESPWVKGAEALVKGVTAMARGGQPRRPQQQFAQPNVPMTYEQQALQQPQPSQQPQQQPQQQQQQPQSQQPQREPSILEQIEFGIRGKAPQGAVVDALMQHFQDPSIQSVLVEAGMDFEVAFQRRLGPWINASAENKAYMEELYRVLTEKLTAAGLFAPELAEKYGEGQEEEGQLDEPENDDE